MLYSIERTQYYDFGIPHSQVNYGAFVRKDSDSIFSIDELANKEIIVQRNDIAFEYLVNLDYKVIAVDSPSDALQLLSSGNHDVAVLSKIVGLSFVNELKIDNIILMPFNVLSMQYCFAVKKGNSELISHLNEGLLIVKGKEEYREVLENWFPSYKETKESILNVALKYVLYVFIPILIIIIVLLLWTWSLRREVKKRTNALHRELKERQKAEHLHKALYKISESASTCSNLSEMYETIHKIINELVPASNLYIALYEVADDLIYFPYFVDEHDLPPTPKKPGRGLTEFVLFTGRPLLASPEVFEQMTEEGKIDLIGAPSVDWLGVPLKVEDKTIGVLVIQSYTEGIRFSEQDKDILLFVSNQITMTILRKQTEEEVLLLNYELEQRVAERTSQLEEALEEFKYENLERRRTQEALEKAQVEIEMALLQEKELNEMKSRFISIVSHEYRTPLTVILSSTYLIEKFFELQNREEFKKNLGNIQSSVQSMTKLLDEILLIGKSDAGKIKLTIGEINIVRFARNTIEEMKLTDKVVHRFEFVSTREVIIIETDSNILQKVLTNLLSNAIKYSESDTLITMKIIENGQYVHLKVIDQGIGIPEEERDKLFESYHRFKNVGAISGTGLGLSIVKRFIDTLKGKIEVESEIGKGSCFTVSLPKKFLNS